MLSPVVVVTKIKKLRQHFGIAAPNVVVTSHLPWRKHFLSVLIVMLLVPSIWITFQHNEVESALGELDVLRSRVRELNDELLKLRSTAGTEKNLAVMERTAQQQLLSRVQMLEAENSALMEDMLLFDKLIPLPGDEALVRVENFRVIKESASRIRYRVLLAFQPVKQSQNFIGRLQLIVFYRQDEKEQQLIFPAKADTETNFSIDMRHFWRKEGVLELPSGILPVRAEARVLQGDTLKAKKLTAF
jgi:hypothetical protein